ncbi:hypothetical protein SESBI_47981 [Sesbania bispinosa]|nr:hypothetical protein SESBI_47981 [Sesbania bispinosa]
MASKSQKESMDFYSKGRIEKPLLRARPVRAIPKSTPKGEASSPLWFCLPAKGVWGKFHPKILPLLCYSDFLPFWVQHSSTKMVFL